MASSDLSRIAGNIGALNALYALQNVNAQLATAQTRLSTGKRINSAEDDPAGFQFASKFQVRSEGLQVAMDIIGDAKNMLSVAEGGQRKINDLLIKIRNKSLEAASDTVGTAERTAVATQIAAFSSQMDDIVTQTTWNGNKLLDGTFTAKLIRTGVDSGDTLTFGISTDHKGATLVSTVPTGTSTAAEWGTFADGIKTDLETVGTAVAGVGSNMARLTAQEGNLQVQHANTEASYNRIMNANMAMEQVNATKFAILQQTSTAMLAQANSGPQYVLSLFR